MVFPHGRPAGNARGCRCAVCRAAETARKRDYRARGGAVVMTMPKGKSKPKPRGVGTVESATIAECEPYEDDRPAMASIARTLAKLLDDPQLLGLHTQASRQLTTILNNLASSKKRKSGARLAAVRQLQAVR